MGIPTNDDGTSYIKQLYKNIDNNAKKLPVPRNGCLCGLKHNFYRCLSEGKAAKEMTEEALQVCQKVLEEKWILGFLEAWRAVLAI